MMLKNKDTRVEDTFRIDLGDDAMMHIVTVGDLVS